MLFSTNKEKGVAGISLAIAYFGSNGYTVSIPLNDTQDYDLIVDYGGNLKKVQVKSCGYKLKSGSYQVQLRSTGGTNGSVYKRVSETDVDLLFILTSDGTMFLIPFDVVKQNTNTITVNKDGINSKYVVFL